MEKIALVTGANRGIGFEACRQLAANGLQVILASRDEEKGQAAAKTLKREGLEGHVCQLEVTDVDSVSRVKAYVEKTFGRLDVLVNNAGVYLDERVSVFNVPLDTVRETMETNFYGPLYLCRVFIPLMKANGYGRVVNVSSEAGSLSGMGGRTAAYRISKTALNALTRILAAEVGQTNIKVNAMCPGWVRTDMGGPAAPRRPAEGADTILWLASLPDDGPSGGFFRDRKSIPW